MLTLFMQKREERRKAKEPENVEEGPRVLEELEYGDEGADNKSDKFVTVSAAD